MAITDLIKEIEIKFNISSKNIRLINSADERRNVFAEFGKAYFPIQPNIFCETIFRHNMLDYAILIYPDKVTDDDALLSELNKQIATAEKEVTKAEYEAQAGNNLLQILSDYINKKDSDSSLVNDEVCKFAKNHEVDSLVYYQTNDARLRNSYYNAIKNYAVRNAELEKITAEFNDNNIDFYFVKGAKISCDYPTPALRIMGDCDIHLHLKDREKASQIIADKGFYVEIDDDKEEWRYHKNGLIIELHHSLCYEYDNAQIMERNFLLDEWSYFNDNCIENEFHFIYLLSHLKKHLISRGVGFRQFFDLAIEVKYNKNLDFNKISNYADKAGLSDFLKICFSLCEKWFQIDVPFKVDLTDEFFKDATYSILHNGVFGFKKQKDEYKDFVDIVNNNGRIKTLLKSVFLPYNDIISSNEYNWLVGKRWLLPIAWICRFFRKIKDPDRRQHGLYIMNKIVSVDTENNKSEFSDWGL